MREIIVDVTAEIVQQGRRALCSECPVAIAGRIALGISEVSRVSVMPYPTWNHPIHLVVEPAFNSVGVVMRRAYKLEPFVVGKIIGFDAGKGMEPFQFTLIVED